MPAKVPIISDDDPLAHVTAPPPDETPTEREARMRAEAEAKQVSDIIDEELDRQRLAEKRAPKALKVLLLGEPILVSSLLVCVLILYRPE